VLAIESQVRIDEIEISFAVDQTEVFSKVWNGTQGQNGLYLVPGDAITTTNGDVTKVNGQLKKYTLIIDQSAFQNISNGDNNISDDVVFELQVKYTPDGGTPAAKPQVDSPTGPYSYDSEIHKSIIFADKTVEVLCIGEDIQINASDTLTGQNNLDGGGMPSLRVNDGWRFSVPVPKYPAWFTSRMAPNSAKPFPLAAVPDNPIAFGFKKEKRALIDGLTSKNGFGMEAELTETGVDNPELDIDYHSCFIGEQRGAYFYVTYGRKKVQHTLAGISSLEFVTDVRSTSGTLDLSTFANAKADVTINATGNEDNINPWSVSTGYMLPQGLGFAGKAVSLGSATSVFKKVLGAAGLALEAWEVANAIYESLPVKASGQAHLYGVIDVIDTNGNSATDWTSDSIVPTSAQAFNLQLVESTQGVSLGLYKNNKPVQLGTCWIIALRASVYAQAENVHPLTHSNSYSKIIVSYQGSNGDGFESADSIQVSSTANVIP
jgi:hypothetical protein